MCVYILIHYWYLVLLIQYSIDDLQTGGVCVTALSVRWTSELSCVLHVEVLRNSILRSSENKKIEFFWKQPISNPVITIAPNYAEYRQLAVTTLHHTPEPEALRFIEKSCYNLAIL